MTRHSPIGASSMYRWSKCPGSVALCEGLPSFTTADARRGIMAHEIAAKALLFDGALPNDLEEEDRDAIQVYLDTVRADQRETDDDQDDVYVEHRFDLSSVYPGCFGTADCVVYHAKPKLLRVYDYKHGAGVPVQVTANSQLRFYALGALLSTKLPAVEVESVVVQPRCFHPDGPVRRERIPTLELVEFAADLKQFAAATAEPGAPLVPGEWCRWCPAAAICPAKIKKAQELAKTEFAPNFSYDPAKLSEALSWLGTLEKWIKATREFAYSEACRGRTPPGWKLVPKRANRKWRDETNLAVTLQQEYGLAMRQIYTQELRSPAQIEKLLRPEMRKTLADLVTKESTGTTLAPESDPRPAASNDPEMEFGAPASESHV